ncbi:MULTISPECIES: hypothetical protein [unclassified Enterobacter]|uniref:hypothetical protein n=1 Tax=unclassified Enterobacter TaxID=2608935 RepID=UPI0016227F0E|nr:MULTISPECIES: hypothetical protein [unclassified Enterobacter]
MSALARSGIKNSAFCMQIHAPGACSPIFIKNTAIFGNLIRFFMGGTAFGQAKNRADLVVFWVGFLSGAGLKRPAPD